MTRLRACARRRGCALLALCLGIAATASAQDAILAGYQQFYAGDTDGAGRHFAQLVAARPADLPARFGDLFVLEERSDTDGALEPEFERKIDAFIADAERRQARSPTDDEALFYLTAGYFLRGQYRFSHGKGTLGAARDGARMKRLAEMYVKRRPEHGDAYLALGVYNYYVELAPAFLRVVRTLLFLPGGDRAEGLKQIERAYRDGSHYSAIAALTLMDVYGTFEARPAEALAIGERLARQYPENPTPQFALAALYLSPAIEDYAAAAERYEAVIAREDRRREERIAKYRARMGLANARFLQWRIEDALAVVTSIIDAGPSTFGDVVPNALLRRANFRALLNDPRAAEDAQRVRANAGWKDFHKGAEQQISWIENRRRSGEATVYAALIPANRLAVSGQRDEAAVEYGHIRQQYPDDVQVRFRLGHLAFLSGDMDRAVTELAQVVDHRSSPTWLTAQALLHLARAHDVRGRRAEAKELYERIVDDYERENAAFAARVGLITPYQRRTQPRLAAEHEPRAGAHRDRHDGMPRVE